MTDAFPISVADEVTDALAAGEPVVALESTLLAHGFPAKERLTLTAELEAEIRLEGAVPATVAILDGQLRVGLDRAALERIAAADAQVAKAAALDVAVHLAAGGLAATTVSATLLAARHAGIRVFATGGIGGVHRGDSADVSSDLMELARSPVVVVSAGAKSILDLPRTLEALETYGVLVVGYRAQSFPAFYVRDSGLPLVHSCNDAAELATVARMRFDELGQGGMLVCNPVAEEHALDAEQIADHIDGAVAAAEAAGVRGKELTPYLLGRLSELTAGQTVACNRALALGNARLAAKIAAAYRRD